MYAGRQAHADEVSAALPHLASLNSFANKYYSIVIRLIFRYKRKDDMEWRLCNCQI